MAPPLCTQAKNHLTCTKKGFFLIATNSESCVDVEPTTKGFQPIQRTIHASKGSIYEPYTHPELSLFSCHKTTYLCILFLYF